MIKIENVETAGWEPAIRGMRNPMNSWDKIDSRMTICAKDGFVPKIELGENDHDLAMKLVKAGTDHSKFMRMIVVYADITAPLYWWKEYSTYKVGTVANSCSTMHCIHKKEFTLDDFSVEYLHDCESIGNGETMTYEPMWNGYECAPYDLMTATVKMLNQWRDIYLNDKSRKMAWWQMIQLLPSSYNQKRTVMMSYQALRNMYHARKNHKLDEWKDFCWWIETLPYSELITT